MALVLGATAAAAPASASAAGLLAAYDRYQTGRGFEIGLVNAATVTLPAGVSTTDDELHPALTPDGRYLVFMRTRLLPKLNGDIVPPEERSLFVADRQAGTVTALNRTGSGPVFESGSGLVWGVRPFANFQQRLVVSRFASFANGALTGSGEELGSPPSGGLVEVTHTDRGLIREFDFFISAERNSPARYLSYAVVDSTTGALRNQIVQFTIARANQSGIGTDGQTKNLGSETAPAGHPDARSDDYVAFHQGAGSAADIQTITFPGTDLAPAPRRSPPRRLSGTPPGPRMDSTSGSSARATAAAGSACTTRRPGSRRSSIRSPTSAPKRRHRRPGPTTRSGAASRSPTAHRAPRR